MNYKDLLERYKKGLLSEDEKKLVEQELERHEAVEDYLSESLAEEFEELADISDLKEQEEETIKVKKSVNKWAKKIIFTSVLIVVILYIGIFHVVSGIVDRMYYDPTIVTEDMDEEYPLADSHFELQAYVGLNLPGYWVNSHTIQESRGFGRYDINYSLLNSFTQATKRHVISIDRDMPSFNIEGIQNIGKHSTIYGRFNVYEHDLSEEDKKAAEEYTERKNVETIEILNRLNPLSYVAMNIVFEKDLNMEEFYYMSNEGFLNPILDFAWVGVRTEDPNTIQRDGEIKPTMGFDPGLGRDVYSSEQPNREKYPMFYLADLHIQEDSITINREYPKRHAEAYETHFKSRLQYLSNSEGFLKVSNRTSYLDVNEYYRKALEYVEENGVKTFGVIAYGTAENFIEALNIIEYEKIHINEVLAAKPYIYD